MFLTEKQLEDNPQNKAYWASEKYLSIRKIQLLLKELEQTLTSQKESLLNLCEKAYFERDERLKFISKLNYFAREEQEESKLAEFLAKRLPHKLYHTENFQIRAELIKKTKEYLNNLNLWEKCITKQKI